MNNFVKEFLKQVSLKEKLFVIEAFEIQSNFFYINFFVFVNKELLKSPIYFKVDGEGIHRFGYELKSLKAFSALELSDVLQQQYVYEKYSYSFEYSALCSSNSFEEQKENYRKKFADNFRKILQDLEALSRARKLISEKLELAKSFTVSEFLSLLEEAEKEDSSTLEEEIPF